MKANDQTFFSKEVLDTLLAKATAPTIISVSRCNSFGAHWLNRVLTIIKDRHQEKINIYAFYIEDPDKVMSLLGAKKSMITYFIKEKEIKASLSGSVSKAKFNEKLSNIL